MQGVGGGRLLERIVWFVQIGRILFSKKPSNLSTLECVYKWILCRKSPDLTYLGIMLQIMSFPKKTFSAVCIGSFNLGFSGNEDFNSLPGSTENLCCRRIHLSAKILTNKVPDAVIFNAFWD